ncbi:MAG TPA: ComEA family DNA-binding protein [Candidatus Limnocylindria bacterium]|nr:ComEA family DNA-binding protein [Candidatus Limnocylindria bacterium]
MPRPLVLAVILAVAAGALVLVVRARAAPPVPIEIVDATPEPTPLPPIVVDVGGAVARPGVVHLAAGARVGDAIAAAGGLTPDADPAALNRAAHVRDGARVYVPRHGEIPPAGSIGGGAELKIDINRATAAELEALPGIGPSTAARIVRAREAKAFTRVEELQTRGLLSARVFADIRDLVTTR